MPQFDWRTCAHSLYAGSYNTAFHRNIRQVLSCAIARNSAARSEIHGIALAPWNLSYIRTQCSSCCSTEAHTLTLTMPC